MKPGSIKFGVIIAIDLLGKRFQEKHTNKCSKTIKMGLQKQNYLAYFRVLVREHVYLAYNINILVDNYLLVRMDYDKDEFQKDFAFQLKHDSRI